MLLGCVLDCCLVQVCKLLEGTQSRQQLGRSGKLPRSRQQFLAGAAAGLAAVLRRSGQSPEAAEQLQEDLRLKAAQVAAGVSSPGLVPCAACVLASGCWPDVYHSCRVLPA